MLMGQGVLFYLAAFVLALGVLIVVHELGHFWVARWCGVKVLRFCIGFGKPLVIRRFGADATEWVVAMIPLGGYVKMLDEREGAVSVEELPRAFNRQSVGRRFMIVAAGPMFNLLLAILLYWILMMQGSDELRPLLAAPAAQTAAAQAGVQTGERVIAINGQPIETWQELRWELTKVALDRQPVRLEVVNERNERALRVVSTMSLGEADLEKDVLGQLGLKLYRPLMKAVVGHVAAGSAAARGGVREADEVLSIDGQPVASWSEVVARTRNAPGKPLLFHLRRGQSQVDLELTPEGVDDGGKRIGRLGIVVRDDPALMSVLFVTVHYPPLTALGKAVTKTWDTAVFSLKMMGRMVTGDLSWKNLSGPVTIADYAGQSASMGWKPYLTFIALISISLGVLNLLPIPILDGGHLLYYIVEFFKGGPLSERVMEIGQQIGMALLMMLMAFAFYNDINRLVSG
jgi:regulator of sigma E protease